MRPTEITGFLGLYQLQFLDENIQKREENFLFIEKTMNGNDCLLKLKHSHIKRLSTFAIPVLCKNEKIKEKYKEIFSNAEIETRPMIAGNIQNQPFYHNYVSRIYDLPETDFIHNNGFYCGNYPEMIKEELEVIKNCLKK